MIVAVMQPYFFPYIGYFQLMQAVDIFIFFDNVQYIDRGWVNRNRIRSHEQARWLTLPVGKASRSRSINEREYLLSAGVPAIKRKLEGAYPSYSDSSAGELIDDLLDYRISNVAAFNANLLVQLALDLGIKCQFVTASELGDTSHLRGENKVIALCKQAGATHYINPIGGAQLYSAPMFLNAGIQLSFLETTCRPAQLASDNVHLSIIDNMLRCDKDSVCHDLRQYRIAQPQSPLPYGQHEN